MSVMGYLPVGNLTSVAKIPKDAHYYATKSLSYAGPILMGCGFFAIIVSCVLYCEIIDRYAVLMPNKPDTTLKRQDLLQMILGEFKKSYFRGEEGRWRFLLLLLLLMLLLLIAFIQRYRISAPEQTHCTS